MQVPLTQIAHQYLQSILQAGDLAIDATAGNGHDSLACAEYIQPGGQLHYIDCQTRAIKATEQRLSQIKGLQCRLVPHLGDHAQVLASLKARFLGQAKAIIFNLGYLPGSDKSIQTQPQSTQRALDVAQQLLHLKGMLLVTAYRGHPGGQEEADCVDQWMEQAIQSGGHARCHSPEKTRASPPQLWCYSRRPLSSLLNI
jgi:hypothetical protein